jgi:hypothetical protein
VTAPTEVPVAQNEERPNGEGSQLLTWCFHAGCSAAIAIHGYVYREGWVELQYEWTELHEALSPRPSWNGLPRYGPGPGRAGRPRRRPAQRASGTGSAVRLAGIVVYVSARHRGFEAYVNCPDCQRGQIVKAPDTLY